ncbi:MAG TPA: hypothetical protein IGS53_04505 [Leptolyngbyaceae cyanobacterium M33_DOE_097]|nr:hypothetical protein [Leptolyngbyaceae cyanobacterium M33_DOE_097]
MLGKIKTQFPVWLYLNQPLFQPHSNTILNPRRFWYRYRVSLLERCLSKACPSKDYR